MSDNNAISTKKPGVTAEQLMRRDLTAVMADETVEEAMHILRS